MNATLGYRLPGAGKWELPDIQAVLQEPDAKVTRVFLRQAMATPPFERMCQTAAFPIVLGKSVSEELFLGDLAAFPHMLIAGAAGSGKSVYINSMIACLLCINTPDQLRMVMIDPKRVELTGYNGIPHLLFPVVVDLERVIGTLQWIAREMGQRYKWFAKVGARNIVEYNRRVVPGDGEKLPYVVVFIDELTDLAVSAPDEIGPAVCRLAQRGHTVGIHLVIAAQLPAAGPMIRSIKPSFPTRISFRVANIADSRAIIDTEGAQWLSSPGNMLFRSLEAGQAAAKSAFAWRGVRRER